MIHIFQLIQYERQFCPPDPNINELLLRLTDQYDDSYVRANFASSCFPTTTITTMTKKIWSKQSIKSHTTMKECMNRSRDLNKTKIESYLCTCPTILAFIQRIFFSYILLSFCDNR